jgi:hypothetical protein
MQEYNLTIEIDENGNIKAETKGIKGDICINELDEVLKGLDGEQNFKNKPEFYQKSVQQKETSKINNK